MRTEARQIAISSKTNTWKQLVTWFARKGIQYDPGSYCGCLQHLFANYCKG